MSQDLYKFHIIGAVGPATPTVEDLWYHWSVIHTSLMLGTEAPAKNFAWYSQNYVNPDLPNEARLINKHPDVNYRTLAEHRIAGWQEFVELMAHPSHSQRMGRHLFGDPKTAKFFLGRGGTVYRHKDFLHPARMTISHWLAPKEGRSWNQTVESLRQHKTLVAAKLEEYNVLAKYTLDTSSEEFMAQLEDSPYKNFPRKEYCAIEWFHFTSVEDGLAFTEKYSDVLRASYAESVCTKTSHSVYGVERVVIDYTDDNPPTKTPLPVFFTDKNSLEYKMMNNDWSIPSQAFKMLDGTKWSSFTSNTDREVEVGALALDTKKDW
ncbi:hypothetical protein V2G26_005331 [Clonostachys chloroleuca]